MRGSAFVVFEVLLWMAAALVVGMVIGWLVRGWRSEEKLRAAVEAAHAEELAERGDLSTRLAAAEARVAELDAARESASREAADVGEPETTASEDEAMEGAGSDAGDAGVAELDAAQSATPEAADVGAPETTAPEDEALEKTGEADSADGPTDPTDDRVAEET